MGTDDEPTPQTEGDRGASGQTTQGAAASLEVATPGPAAARRSWPDAVEQLAIVIGIVGLCVFVRLLWLEPIEISGDNTFKWHFVRQWFHNNDFSHAKWDHHMARLGINVPLFVVQALSSETPRAYYVAPIASYSLQVLLVYLVGRRLGGLAVGVLAAVWLTLFTGMNRDGSQLLPDGFGGTALVLTFYLLVRYHDARGAERRRWLIGCGLAFVWAYFVKESNLLLLPGLLLAIWLIRRSWRDAVLVGGMLATAFVLETAAYRLFTDYSSRFAMVQEAHGIVHVRFPELFNRFTRLEPPWQMVVWTWMASLFGLLASRDARVRALLVIPASFIFFLTFLVRSVDPIVLWTRFMSRYFGAPLPLMIVAVVLFCGVSLRNAWPVYVPPPWQGLPARLARHGAALSFGFCALLVIPVYTWEQRSLAEHPLAQLPIVSRVVNDAYRRNLPIVQEKEKSREERARGLEAIYAVFVKSKDILSSPLAKDGRLPDIAEAIDYDRTGKKRWRRAWLLRDRGAYGKGDVEKLDDDGCAVRVTIEHGRFFTIEHELLPERCRAPVQPAK